MIYSVCWKFHFSQAKFLNCWMSQTWRTSRFIRYRLQKLRKNLMLSLDRVWSLKRIVILTSTFLRKNLPQQSWARLLSQNICHKHISQWIWWRIFSYQLIDIIGSKILLFPSWNLRWWLITLGLHAWFCSQRTSGIEHSHLLISDIPTGCPLLSLPIYIGCWKINLFYFII